VTDTVPARASAGAVRPTSRRRLWAGGLVILAALGFLLFKGLGNATVYFKTADEAVRDRTSLGTHRFRIEGTVVPGTKKETPDGVSFLIVSNNVSVPVTHHGGPPELFRDDIPVVLEGHWAGARYDSDRIMVKHTATYRARNPDRVKDYPANK